MNEFGVGMKLKYLKDGIEKTAKLEAWNHHQGFTELFLSNGDAIVDEEVTCIID